MIAGLQFAFYGDFLHSPGRGFVVGPSTWESLTGRLIGPTIPGMKLELPLAEMSVAEKLEAMETLWADLSRSAPEWVIPEWHASVLEQRERRLASGEEEVLDWDEAKRRLRREIHEGSNP